MPESLRYPPNDNSLRYGVFPMMRGDKISRSNDRHLLTYIVTNRGGGLSFQWEDLDTLNEAVAPKPSMAGYDST